jgi:hypothetical protein
MTAERDAAPDAIGPVSFVSAKDNQMKVAALAILFLIMLASAVFGAEVTRSTPVETKERAEQYFECRAIAANDLRDPNAPTFTDYSVAAEAPVKHPRVDTATTTIGREYRTVLRNGIESGANYAGHYAVVTWGCGTSCSSFAVVNLKTGQVIVPKGIYSVTGNFLSNTVKQFLSQGLQGSWGYRYRLDSRLLVLVGMLNEDENREGAHYFVLENNTLRQVHQTPVIKNCNH